MNRIAILLLLCLSSIANAETKSDDSSFDEIQGLMIASKMAGMCGAIKQMAIFQESTNMPGGMNSYRDSLLQSKQGLG